MLIINGAGGAGSAGIQLAKKLSSLRVIATASRDESKAWCLSQGADIILDHSQPLAAELGKQDITAVDYIYCCYNTSAYFEAMASIIKPKGRICSIVDAEAPININLLKAKRVSFHWEFMGLGPTLKAAELSEHGNILRKIADLVDAGDLKATLARKFSGINAKNLREAHRLLEEQKVTGKLVLESWR